MTAEPIDLDALVAELLAQAQQSASARGARTVYAGDPLRQTVIALRGGAELAEHDSPPEATLQVLQGSILLRGQAREWALTAGDLVPIPPERHSVVAVEDSAFLLTVRAAR